MSTREGIPHTDQFLQTFHAAANHAGVPAEPVQPADERTKVRCGNHGKDFRVYHGSVAEVRACCATYAAPKRQEEKPECEGHESLDGAHMSETVYCDGSCRKKEKRDIVHPRPSGWWNLPVSV